MKGQLGFFTCYDLEYIFEFLGEDRINKKIEELDLNKDGSMGIDLRSFTYSLPDNSYLNEKGVLHVLGLIMNWFNDLQTLVYLYRCSKKYNELNYYDGFFLKNKWQNQLTRNKLRNNSVEFDNIVEATKLSYWNDYHFFFLDFSKRFEKEYITKKLIDTDFEGFYNVVKNKLFGKITLEIKTRRKPLTGKYILYRVGQIWFNLDLIKSENNFDTYEFVKNENKYHLIVDYNKAEAHIVIKNVSSFSKSFLKHFQNSGIEEIWLEIIETYLLNFHTISYYVNKSFLGVPDVKLSNGVMWVIYNFYLSINDLKRAREIAILNNSKSEIWREIPEPKFQL